MIRPKVRAIKSQRATGERHNRDVFDLRLFFSRIESRDGPALTVLFGPAQDVDHSINKCVARYLGTNVDNANDIANRIQFKNAMFVPLTQVEMFAVIAKVRPRKIRTSDPIGLGKTGFGNEPSNVAMGYQAVLSLQAPPTLSDRSHRFDSGRANPSTICRRPMPAPVEQGPVKETVLAL
jgi:hypothetical protein